MPQPAHATHGNHVRDHWPPGAPGSDRYDPAPAPGYGDDVPDSEDRAADPASEPVDLYSTDAALVEARREGKLVREKGYEGTTLQDVAARAGMTSGAIYGNFKNRDDLFLALGLTYWPPIVPRYRPDATFAEKMRALAEATLAAIPARTSIWMPYCGKG